MLQFSTVTSLDCNFGLKIQRSSHSMEDVTVSFQGGGGGGDSEISL